jgi:hypothetical protein
MKTQAVFFALLSFAASASASSLYSFEELEATAHPLPAAIEAELDKSQAAKLQDCQRQLGASDEQMRHYFTAVPVGVGGGKTPSLLLVLPTRYCYAFIGSHAISFWVFVDAAAPKLVLTGRRDALEILDSQSHGLPDLAGYYGTKSIRYEYDGEQYVSPDE